MYDDAPPFTRRRSASVRWPPPTCCVRRRGAATSVPTTCAALSPDEAGRLVADLAAAGRLDALAWSSRSTPPHRYPLAALLRAAAAPARDEHARGMLVRAVGPGAPLSAALGARRGRRRSRARARCSPRWPPRAPSSRPGRRTAGGARRRWRWPSPGHGSDDGPETAPSPTRRSSAARRRRAPASPTPASTSPGTERPDVVVIDQPFEVTLGLQPARTAAWSPARRWSLQVGETVELEVVLLHDPTSIEVTGSPRRTLTVTDLAALSRR